MGDLMGDLMSSNAHREATIAALEHEFSQLYTRARERVWERAGMIHPELSPLGYQLLLQVYRHGPAQAQQLSHQLGTDKSMVSRLVKWLLEVELVHRYRDPEDGRAFVLALTPAAVERLEAANVERQQRLRHLLTGWQLAEIEQLTKLLAKLHHS